MGNKMQQVLYNQDSNHWRCPFVPVGMKDTMGSMGKWDCFV